MTRRCEEPRLTLADRFEMRRAVREMIRRDVRVTGSLGMCADDAYRLELERCALLAIGCTFVSMRDSELAVVGSMVAVECDQVTLDEWAVQP